MNKPNIWSLNRNEMEEAGNGREKWIGEGSGSESKRSLNFTILGRVNIRYNVIKITY